MPGERLWVVVDLYALTMVLLCGSYLLSDSDHRTLSAFIATFLSGVAVMAGIGFRRGLWRLAGGRRRKSKDAIFG